MDRAVTGLVLVRPGACFWHFALALNPFQEFAWI
jgi:hypothetical protein